MKPTLLFALALAASATVARAQDAPSTYAPLGVTGAAHPSLPAARVPDALGVNIHFTNARPGEAAMIAAAGYRVARMDFAWGSTERERGVYDWSAYDRLAQTLADSKIKPYFILDYGNALYSPSSTSGPFTDEADTPAFREGFSKWAAAAASHFKGRGIIWEIWNEPNIAGFWKPAPDAASYSRLALSATRAIKAAAPGECVVGPGASTIDMAFLEACFKAGLLQLWDAVSVHPYRQSAPETANAEYRDLRRAIDKHKPRGKNVPILSGEWGYSSGWGDFNEEIQGKYLPRLWLTNLYNRVPASIWYDWHDDGADPKDPEHHFGSVQNQVFEGRAEPYDAKPAYIAARTLSQQLDGYTLSKRLWMGREDQWVLLFTRGAQVKLVAWISDSATTSKPAAATEGAAGQPDAKADRPSKSPAARTLSLPSSAGSFSVVDYLGAPKPTLLADRNKLIFLASDSVTYITPRGPNELLSRAAAWPAAPLERWVQAPFRVDLRGAEPQAAASTGVLNGATSREEAPPDPALLLRDSEPLLLVARDGRDRSSSFLQATQIAVANPLQVLAGPGESPETLRVTLRSPSAGAESGAVRVAVAHQKPITIPYTIEAGQTEARLDVPGAFKDGTPISVVALDERGRPSVRARALRFVALDSFSRPGADSDYAALPDGDAKVASTQSLALAAASAPLGGQKVKALRLDYSWAEGWKFLRLLPPATLKLQGKPSALQMWIYGDGSGNLARLRVRDESGQTFQPSAEPAEINWTGWKQVSFALDGRNSGHWGGANDGVVHGELAWDSVFLLDSAGKRASKGSLYLASPTLVYEEENMDGRRERERQ